MSRFACTLAMVTLRRSSLSRMLTMYSVSFSYSESSLSSNVKCHSRASSFNSLLRIRRSISDPPVPSDGRGQLPQLHHHPIRVVAVSGPVASEEARIDLLRLAREADTLGRKRAVGLADVADHQRHVIGAHIAAPSVRGIGAAHRLQVLEEFQEEGAVGGGQLHQPQMRILQRHLPGEHLARHLSVQHHLHPEQPRVEGEGAVHVADSAARVMDPPHDHLARLHNEYPPSTTRVAPAI